jgi:two-component system chemotaxis response regulator CheB
MIRVLVAEDSPTARALLVEMLTSDPEIRVVGEAKTGSEAVSMAEALRPDLITMDVQMPEIDGLEATMRIMTRVPVPIIVVSSLASVSEMELSLEATRAGALMVLPKPEGPMSPRFAEQRAQLVLAVKSMAQVKVVRRWGASNPALRTSVGRSSATSAATSGEYARVTPGGIRQMSERPRIVAIGASTGGPAALRDMLAELPPTFSVPVLVVQHISKGFVGGLALWLGASSRLRVRVAQAGDVAKKGHVYIAPDDRHLGIRDDFRIVLSNDPPIGSFRPSASHLFASAASAFGAATVAVILTGMGDDGLHGLRAVHAAGGLVIAQDEATSVIWGMPREAIRAGLAGAIVPLGEMASRLVEVVS